MPADPRRIKELFAAALELTDLPQPSIGPRDLLVRVKACGICGSDVHGYDGTTGRRIPPVVMGHEAAGEVAPEFSRADIEKLKANISQAEQFQINFDYLARRVTRRGK